MPNDWQQWHHGGVAREVLIALFWSLLYKNIARRGILGSVWPRHQPSSIYALMAALRGSEKCLLGVRSKK